MTTMLISADDAVRQEVAIVLRESNVNACTDEILEGIGWYGGRWKESDDERISELNARLLAVLNETEARRLTDVYFIMGPSSDANGLIVELTGGGIVVVINIGLHLALFEFMVRLVTAINQDRKNDSRGLFDTVNALFCLAERACTGVEVRFLGDDNPHLLDYHKIDPELRRNMDLMTQVQVDFVIVHELSHILLNHLDRTPSLTTGECLLSSSKDSRKQEFEFEADAKTVQILSRDNKWLNLFQLSLPGLFSFFTLIDSHREFLRVFAGQHNDKSAFHPSASDRYHSIATAIGGCDDEHWMDGQKVVRAVRDIYGSMRRNERGYGWGPSI